MSTQFVSSWIRDGEHAEIEVIMKEAHVNRVRAGNHFVVNYPARNAIHRPRSRRVEDRTDLRVVRGSGDTPYLDLPLRSLHFPRSQQRQ